MRCKLCSAASAYFGRATILLKYDVQYFRCSSCSFVQTEEPYWLAEAYSDAIASLDVGIMQRNVHNTEVTGAMISLLFSASSRYVDFAGGHGVLVRMLRDRGFDFRWLDRYANNIFARGFEHIEGNRYDLLTAYEVLEHFVNPLEDFEALLAYSDNLLLSTVLIPDPPPQPPDWWYYAVNGGQHISFYSRNSLAWLAKRFGLCLLSHGQHHLFTRIPKMDALFRLAVSGRTAPIANRLRKRNSLVAKDFEQVLLAPQS
ncbi:MAG TPA: class I SAM-dependent methyltransferase [Terracidiphilus sp.]|jgi:hypothetical protein|nr:class I SAM-dependent methyltransferase [Terracidiphilus sp.]